MGWWQSCGLGVRGTTWWGTVQVRSEGHCEVKEGVSEGHCRVMGAAGWEGQGWICDVEGSGAL